MDRLWAPWRHPYITRTIQKTKGCIFCRARQTSDDRKNYLLARSAHALTMLNIYPYNNGHVMVAPDRHVATLEKLNEKELLDLLRQVRRATRALDRCLKPQGYNIGINLGRAAGAGVDKHLHVHIVPRWNGDSNFMPTLASTKVISQSLDSLYGMLRKALR